MKEKTTSLLFGIDQFFFYYSIIQYLVLIIIKNSVDIEKAKANKIRKVGREEKHVIQV